MISTRRLPINLDPLDRPLFKHEFEKKFQEITSLQLKDALVTPDGVIISKGRIVNESLFTESHLEYYSGVYLNYFRFMGSFVPKLGDHFLLAFDSWSIGYFHWMTEVIPRIFRSQELLESHTLLLPSVNNGIWNKESAIRSLLKRYARIPYAGYLSESLLPFHINKTYQIPPRLPSKFGFLTLQGHIAPSGNYDDVLMRSLRDFYLSYYNLIGGVPKGRIYASRKKATRRHVINEEEVCSVLSSLGFEIVCLEELSFSAQVKLLSETRVLISLHGAALTNIMFMAPNTYALELKANGDSMNHCYFSLASALQVNYLYQFCKTDQRSVQNADIEVDIDKLRQNIALIK